MNLSDFRPVGGPGDAAAHSLPRTDVRYWKARLMERKYIESIKLIAGREYSTRIEHDGIGFFFPLESGEANRAAAIGLWSHGRRLARPRPPGSYPALASRLNRRFMALTSAR